jgi:hypothetical protein
MTRSANGWALAGPPALVCLGRGMAGLGAMLVGVGVSTEQEGDAARCLVNERGSGA